MRRLVRRFLLLGILLLVASFPFVRTVAGRFASPWEMAGGLALLLGLGMTVTALLFLYVIFPRLERGTTAFTDVAESVADGDLRANLAEQPVGGFQRQWRIFGRMLEALRGLVTALRTVTEANRGTAARLRSSAATSQAAAAGLAESTEAVAAQADAMNEAIAALAADAEQLGGTAAQLSAEAETVAARNARVRRAAAAGRERLAEGTARLDVLEADARESADAVEALAATAEEIRSFTVLVQHIARQSKILSLNAAMEAARFGEAGEGFAVVSAEVRRLAQASSDAADRTQALVRTVLERVEASRATSARVREALAAVGDATREGAATLATIDAAAADADRLSTRVREAAATADALAQGVSARLAGLADGTTALARVARALAETGRGQQAASAEQRSLADEVSRRADELAALLGRFRLPDEAA
jgi:methyl-accepting chemotaxis protein